MKSPHRTANTVIAGVVGIMMSGCSLFGRQGVEEAVHSIVLKDDNIEVRQYEDAIVAQTVVDASEKRPDKVSFDRLGGYIFGDNKSKESIAMTAPVVREKPEETRSEKIAMTAPVVREPAEAGYLYKFYMPSEYTMETLPEPTNTEVVLKKEPGKLVAAIRYSGTWSESNRVKYEARLRDWIGNNAYEPISEARWAGYDPPWTIPAFRRNEVLIDVREKLQEVD